MFGEPAVNIVVGGERGVGKTTVSHAFMNTSMVPGMTKTVALHQKSQIVVIQGNIQQKHQNPLAGALVMHLCYLKTCGIQTHDR